MSDKAKDKFQQENVDEVRNYFNSSNSIKDIPIEELSEKKYIELVGKVIDISNGQLEIQNINKEGLRGKFTKYFKWLLSIQYLVLVVLLVLNATLNNFNISDTVFLTYISSVFVETLGVIIIMVKFAYDNKTENQILEVLRAVVGEYKKYKENDKKEAK